MSTDAALLSSFASGRNQDAFAELVRRHGALVQATCLRATNGDRSAAEDAMQEVFAELAKQAGRIRGALPAWLYVVARRRGAAQHRQERLSECAAEPGDAGAAARGELRVLVEDALDHLPEDQRAVVVLRFLEQRSQEEIAELLGISQSTVSRRLQAGLERLRVLIGAPALVLPLDGVLDGMAAPPLAAPMAAKLGTLALGLTPAAGWGLGALLTVAVTLLAGIAGVAWWQWPAPIPVQPAAVASEALPEPPRNELAAWRAAAKACPLPTFTAYLRLASDEHELSDQAAVPAGLVTHINGMPFADVVDPNKVLGTPGTILTVQRLWQGQRPLTTSEELLTYWHPGFHGLRLESSTMKMDSSRPFILIHNEDLRLAALRTIPEGAWDADLNQALQAYDARDWPTLLQACERLQAAQAPDQIVRLLGSIGSLYSHQVQAQQRWMQVKPGDTPHVAFLINSSKQIAESKQPEEKPKGWKQVGLDGVASWADELRHGGANYRWGEGYRIAWTLPSGDIDLAWRIRIGNNGQRAALKNPLHFLRVVLGDAPPSTDQNVVVKHPIQELADLTVWSIGRVQSARTKLNTWLPQQVVQEPGPNDHRIRIRIIGQQASIWWDGVLLVNTPLANSPKGLWLLSEGLKCIHSDLVVHAPDGPDPEPLTLAMLADDPVALRRGDPAWVLRQAAFAGKRKILSEGIRQHPELIDAVDQSGWTPLQLAAFAGHADLARQLLEAHADPGKRNQWDWTALDYALTMGVTQTGFLAPKADGDPWQLLRQWQIQPTALRSLDAIGRLPPAFAALAMRGDVDAALATGDRDPRLAFAAVELHMDQVLERLKTAGVPLTGTWPGSNETLLHWAITRRRDPALARTLKRLGVDPHAPAAWGADAVATARSLGMERLADDLEQEPGKPAVKNNF